MSYPYIFDADTLEHNKTRLDSLMSIAQPLWGKMNAAQMLAHLNIYYKVYRGELDIKTNAVLKFLLKIFIKKSVVGNKPYLQSRRTASYFLIKEEKDFETEKKELLKNMLWAFEKGEDYFEGKVATSFGALTAKEWSNLFQKHLDHHFNQFGI